MICFVNVLLRSLLTAKRYRVVQLTLCFRHSASVYSTSKCNCACQSAYPKMTIPQRLQARLHCVHYKVSYNLYFIPLEELRSVFIEKIVLTILLICAPNYSCKNNFCTYSTNITRRHQVSSSLLHFIPST